jgi:hypothetical protein
MHKVVKILTFCCNRAEDDKGSICEIEDLQKRQEIPITPAFGRQLTRSYKGKTLNDDEPSQKGSQSKSDPPNDDTDLVNSKKKTRKQGKKGKRNKKGSQSRFSLKSEEAIENPPVTISIDNPVIIPGSPAIQTLRLEQQQEETKTQPKPLKGILKKR